MSAEPPPDPVLPPDELTYAEAVLPLIVLAVLVAGSVALFGLDAMAGPLQVAMSLAAMTASLNWFAGTRTLAPKPSRSTRPLSRPLRRIARNAIRLPKRAQNPGWSRSQASVPPCKNRSQKNSRIIPRCRIRCR